MATEVLVVKEDILGEVIEVIRDGLRIRLETSNRVREFLEEWCEREEQYLRRMAGMKECPLCEGTGERRKGYDGTNPTCPGCNGTGEIDGGAV